MNVAQTDRQNTRDWPYTEAQMRQIADGVRREAYPPAGRTGIGAALRKPEAA